MRSKEERREYNRKNYLEHRDERRPKFKEYYYKNRDKRKEEKKQYATEYYVKNREIIRQKSIQHYLKNRDRILSQNKLYRDNHKEQAREYRARNRSYFQEYCKMYWENNRVKLNASIRKRYNRIRVEVIGHYSNGKNECACCAENNIKFLSFDHIHGGGRQHRKKLLKYFSFASWLKKQNYPEGIQILCYNCNLGRQHNGGTCPHKEVIL